MPASSFFPSPVVGFLLLGAAVAPASAQSLSPVITELMFHAPHAEFTREPVEREWLEIANPGPTVVDMSGWQLNRGVDLVFAEGTLLPPLGRLVVAAKADDFRAAYPGFAGPLIDGWTGRLSNSGELVRLVDRSGATVDEVEYADEGDWATRVRTAADSFGRIGWDWENPADGGGASLEKNVEPLRGSFGRNWRVSALPGGTPGASNTASASTETTFITNVKATPAIPRPGQPVVVTARIQDVLTGTMLPEWQLWWRVDGTAAWQTVEMTVTSSAALIPPDPAGQKLEVMATIPGQPNRAVVEFYVQAQGANGSATWPPAARISPPGIEPAVFAQETNALIQVDDSFNPSAAWTPGAQPVYRLVLTAAELAYLRSLQTNSGQSDSAATMNATFISLDGTGQDVRWQCGVRNRGYSSRNGPPNNYHLSFPGDARWQELGSIQFNCRYPHSQVLGTAAYALAGIPVQEAAAVQVRLNGTNYAAPFSPGNSFNGTVTYGSYARVETLGGDWTRRHYPDDSEGNMYRVDDHDQGNSSVSNDFRYPGSANPDLYDDVYFKQTNQDLNDYADLAGLFNTLNNAPAASFHQEISTRLDLDQWIAYFAIDSLMGNQEGGLVSGRTDDFSMYAGVVDPRFRLVPHDMDTTFNYGIGGAGNPVTRSLFSFVTAGGGVAGLQNFFNDPDVLRAYYAKVLELMDSVFTRARLDPLIDQLLGGWVDPVEVQVAKRYIDDRRANVLGQIERTFSLTSDLATVTDGFRVTSTGNAVLSGTFHVARTRSILVNGQAATMFYRASGTNPAGSWRFNTAGTPGFLRPGVTRVTAEFFGGPNGTGELLDRQTLDILNTSSGSFTEVTPGGVALGSSLFLEAPAHYLPGVPFMIKVERRDAVGLVDRSVWTESVTLTASNGVVLSAADRGAATVTLLNGRGSLLVTVAGGSGPVQSLIAPGGTPQAPAAAGALWKYLDSGAAPPTAWRSDPGFNDSLWRPEGQVGAPGQLGDGDGDERTVVANVPSSSTVANPRFTWYFRHRFSVADPSVFNGLTIRTILDDGGAVYLNGTPVLRVNLAEGATHTTPALTNRTGVIESSFESFALPATALVPGENLIAVEVHNARTSTTAVSVDLGFDLELLGREPASNPGDFTMTATSGALTATRGVASLGTAPPVLEVSGELAADAAWSGVVRVTGDLTVPAGRTLTIQPGAHVLFAGTAGAGNSAGSDLIVNGTLVVAGTASEPVTMTAATADTRWGELLLTGGGTSTISHAFISRGAHSPGRGHTGRGPMIRLNGASLTLEDSVVGDAPGKAIYTQGAGSLLIRRTHVARCVTGPELGDGMALTLEDSHLTDFLPVYREANSPTPDDEDALYFHNSSAQPVLIRRSVLGRCGDDVIDGLGGPVVVEDSIIREGWDKGLSLLNNDLVMTRTLVIDCDKALVPKSSTAATRTIVLSHCTIVSEDHDTTRGPWGYPINPSSPDADTPSTGLYTQNKSGQSNAGATLAITAKNSIIIAKEPVKVDAPYPAAGTIVTYSITRDVDQPATPAWPGAGNLIADPLFVPATAPARDFHLQAGSPAIDSGDPASPLDSDGSRADRGALPYGVVLTGSPTEIVWKASQSPLHIAQNVVIPSGTTLTIEPGVTVYFDRNRRLTVNGWIQVLGTPQARVTFSHVPGTVAAGDADPLAPGVQTGPPKWGGLRIVGSMSRENVVQYADFVNAQGTSSSGAENYGSLGVIRSWVLCDHLTFSGTKLRMLYGRNCKLTVQHCLFPDMFGPGEDPIAFGLDNVAEQLKVEFPTTDPELQNNAAFVDGFPVGGWWRVYANDFFGNKGHNDVFDADSGRWGQTFVLDCRYNHFHGLTGDDHIDLGGDAYIASNYFERGIKDEWTSDTGYSNAISSGDRGIGTTIMVARNVFSDIDHAINLKARTATIFEHNTAARFHADYQYVSGPPYNIDQAVKNSLVNLFIPEDGAVPTAGDGGYLGYNLASEVPRLVSGADHNAAGLGKVTSKLEFNHNLVDQIADLSIGPNHPGGITAPEWGVNVFGAPGFVDAAAGDFGLAPGSLARGSAPGGLDYGATVPEWAYVIGGPMALSPVTAATFTIGGPGIVAFRWSLDGGAWSQPATIGSGGVFSRTAPTVRQAELALTGLSAAGHVLRVLGQDFAGNWQPEALATTRTWTVDPSLRLVLINEIVADAGAEPDWVELHNAGAMAVDLGGWSLGRRGNIPVFTFPPGTALAAGAFLRVTTPTTGLVSDNDGDTLTLFEGPLVRDTVDFGAQPAGFSLARLGFDRAWGLGVPTPGAANEAARLGPADGLRISEWLAATDVRYTEDWVELFNSSDLPVAVGGCVLTDNLPGRPRAHVLAPLSFIAPRAHIVLLSGGGDGPDQLSFKLNALEDRLTLLDADGRLLDERVFYGQTNDFSQSTGPEGQPVFNELPTRGFAMPATDPVAQNALAVLRGLRITEIMYHARQGNEFDWLELRNVGPSSFNLGGTRFVEGIEFTFPSLTLLPGQAVVLVANEGEFRSLHGNAPVIAGPYTGRLDNGGETLALRLAAPFDANVLRFRYEDDWYQVTDGLGRSLDLASLSTPVGDFDRASSWSASEMIDGSPGVRTQPVPTTYAAWKAFYGVPDDAADGDADTLMPLLEFSLGLDPRIGSGQHGPAALPAGRLESDGRLSLICRLPVNAAAPQGHGLAEIRYVIQGGGSLTGWTTLATKTPTSAWSGSATITLGPVVDRYQEVVVTDAVGWPDSSARQLRMQVTWTP